MVTNSLEFFIKNYKPNLVRRSWIFHSLHASKDIITKNWDLGHYHFSDIKAEAQLLGQSNFCKLFVTKLI